MADIIKGNNDGENGENDSYTIPGRGSHIPRPTVVREVKQNFGVYERNGVEYVRGKPDKRASELVRRGIAG